MSQLKDTIPEKKMNNLHYTPITTKMKIFSYISWQVKVMTSIRKPKRITIRGNDEREYHYLVKGGEDLRQDQRIEQLFFLMNQALESDPACKQRNLKIKTYQVIPMTSRFVWLSKLCFYDYRSSSTWAFWFSQNTSSGK